MVTPEVNAIEEYIEEYQQHVAEATRLLDANNADAAGRALDAAKDALALADWSQFFALVGAAVPNAGQLQDLLLGAVHASASKGYHHCSRRLLVPAHRHRR